MITAPIPIDERPSGRISETLADVEPALVVDPPALDEPPEPEALPPDCARTANGAWVHLAFAGLPTNVAPGKPQASEADFWSA